MRKSNQERGNIQETMDSIQECNEESSRMMTMRESQRISAVSDGKAAERGP